MAKQLQYKRLLMLALLLAMAFAGLGYRLVDLQVLRHDELSKEARKGTHYAYALTPKRGDILDRNGNLLATSVFVKTVCADPSLIGNKQAEVARAIAPLLGLQEADLVQRLTPRTRLNTNGEIVTNRYVVLQHKVTLDVCAHIQQVMDGLNFGINEKQLSKAQKTFYRDLRAKAIFTAPDEEQVRIYPNQSLAAHVIGYMGFPQTTNGTVSTNIVGLDGIERTFESKLQGVRGWRETERDNHNRELVAYREEDLEPHDGLNVVLTIDTAIQHILEEELAVGLSNHHPESINGMVVRPQTGEILAMATLPTFDPNNLSSSPLTSRRNHIVADMQEPGSTFKIVVISGALNDHVVTLNEVFNCENGRFWFCGKLLTDHGKGYPELTVEQIITKSSNIGAAKVGMKMGEPRLFRYICDFGFGVRTGIELPSESAGKLRTNWSKLSISRVPMGQEVGVTPLQMMMAMCAVANNGVLMKPMIVDRLVDEDGNVVLKNHPKEVRRVISPEADRLMIQALKTVVTTNGTAPEARLDDYTIAGKTGTAQEADKHGYIEGKYYSSFIGFFPADKPEICIYVGMDSPKGVHYGGTVSAPVFREVAKKVANYLNIRPDKSILPAGSEPAAGTQPPMRTAQTALLQEGSSGAKY